MQDSRQRSGLRDNRSRGPAHEFLESKVAKGSELSFVSAYFTSFAYNRLAATLDDIRHYASFSASQIEIWIRNHEKDGKAAVPFYHELLEERARRSKADGRLDFEKSLAHLKAAAVSQKCTTYGALAAASEVNWSKARYQMNGPSGHLDRLLDICHARGLPLLTAICVNQSSVADGELGEEALAGFAAGARRLGLSVSDPTSFHHAMRDECWRWGAERSAI